MQWPVVVARLVTMLPTLTGWAGVTVYDDAPPDTDVPPVYYATIGWTENNGSGQYTFAQNNDGVFYLEQGAVNCELCASGDEDITTVRTVAVAAMNSLEAAIRADRRLGVLSAEGFFTIDAAPNPVLDEQGGSFWLPFSLNYYTVT